MPLLALLLGCTSSPGDTGPAGTFVPGDEPTRYDPPFGVGMPRPAEPIADPAKPEALAHPGTAPFPNVDVLIVGAGPAGLAAALEASRTGATVAVLEREDTFGGSANWAGALMMFSGAPEQAAAGVTDSAEQLLAEWPSFTGGDPNDAWVQAFATRNVSDVHDWLAALGVGWNGPASDSSAGTTPRILSVNGGGPALVAAMEAPLGGDVILYEAEATELVQDRTGRVIGATWRDLALDEAHFARADTVIVATGGFLHDLDRVRAERPDLADRELRWGSWPGADGNGLAMVEAIGGATENLDAVGLYAHGVPAMTEWDELRTPFLSSVPWINVTGARFTDESDTNGFATGEVRAEQPDGLAWAIFDAAIAASASFEPSEPGASTYDIEDMLAAGLVTEADDLPTLAASLGVDADVVSTEVSSFNDFTIGLAVDAYRETPSRVTPVVVPPFYAVPVAITVAKGFGGVDVDLSGRVLDTDGAVIPGLYAAGELTGMAGGTLVGSYGFTGSLTAVILGGRVAGAAAAAEVLGE